eukprot:jgi/Bigna1/76267/fgenesh1_pg.40_\
MLIHLLLLLSFLLIRYDKHISEIVSIQDPKAVRDRVFAGVNNPLFPGKYYKKYGSTRTTLVGKKGFGIYRMSAGTTYDVDYKPWWLYRMNLFRVVHHAAVLGHLLTAHMIVYKILELLKTALKEVMGVGGEYPNSPAQCFTSFVPRRGPGLQELLKPPVGSEGKWTTDFAEERQVTKYYHNHKDGDFKDRKGDISGIREQGYVKFDLPQRNAVENEYWVGGTSYISSYARGSTTSRLKEVPKYSVPIDSVYSSNSTKSSAGIVSEPFLANCGYTTTKLESFLGCEIRWKDPWTSTQLPVDHTLTSFEANVRARPLTEEDGVCAKPGQSARSSYRSAKICEP